MKKLRGHLILAVAALTAHLINAKGGARRIIITIRKGMLLTLLPPADPHSFELLVSIEPRGRKGTVFGQICQVEPNFRSRSFRSIVAQETHGKFPSCKKVFSTTWSGGCVCRPD
jgi:hypothetical protein